MRIKLVMFFIVLLFLTACATAKLTPEAKNIMLRKGDVPTSCKELGNVSGQSGPFEEGDKDKIAKNRMKNKAAKLGANYVQLEKFERLPDGLSIKATGKAFYCP